MKNVVILGSSGSIGCTTLNVIRHLRADFSVLALAGGVNVQRVAEQVREFNVRYASMADAASAAKLKTLVPESCTVLFGREGLETLATLEEADSVIFAVVGTASLSAALCAARAGKRLCVATKEILVMAGALLKRLARENGAEILPVDSEHSAIFQCLHGVERKSVRRLILTASGGPFRGKDRAFLDDVTPEKALAHPTWHMGQKVTLDSATLMNKALEVIEAHVLFDMPHDAISAVVHPQSIIHSMVEFSDGALMAQMGEPSMQLPIAYALNYPHRPALNPPLFDFTAHAHLSFEPVDDAVFPSLTFARYALERGGVMPCVLNAANEVAVERFFKGDIRFTDIFHIVGGVLEKTQPACSALILDAILDADAQARCCARSWVCG